MGLFATIGSVLGSNAANFVGNLAGSVGGSLLTSAAQKKEAEKNRKFQAYMSNTAHQREVRDLYAAGLNPILSAGGSGASTPSGAQANISDLGESLSRGISTAVANKAMRANVQQIRAGMRVTNEQAKQAQIKTKMVQDMYDYYNSSVARRTAAQSAMLSKESGLRPEAGVVLDAATSTAAKFREWLNSLPARIEHSLIKKTAEFKKGVEKGRSKAPPAMKKWHKGPKPNTIYFE